MSRLTLEVSLTKLTEYVERNRPSARSGYGWSLYVGDSPEGIRTGGVLRREAPDGAGFEVGTVSPGIGFGPALLVLESGHVDVSAVADLVRALW